MEQIQIEADGDDVSIFIFPDKYISITKAEAKVLAGRLYVIASDEWKRPDCKHLDAKKIIADYDARRKAFHPEPMKPARVPRGTKSRKKSFFEEIEGI